MADSPHPEEPDRRRPCGAADPVTLSHALLFSGTLSQICQCCGGYFDCWLCGVLFCFFPSLNLVAMVTSVKFLMESAAVVAASNPAVSSLIV